MVYMCMTRENVTLCNIFIHFQLIELLQSSPARGLELSVWIRAVFTAHTAYLMTVRKHAMICIIIMLFHVRGFPKLAKWCTLFP
jgi:hypothetical protein